MTVAFVPAAFVPAGTVPGPGGFAPSRPCIAFAISRKVGPAVERNRLRRRLRDELGSLARAQHLVAGSYLVSLAPAAAALDGPTLRAHLRGALGVTA